MKKQWIEPGLDVLDVTHTYTGKGNAIPDCSDIEDPPVTHEGRSNNRPDNRCISSTS
ncbi:paeninodin family lasso peptide [Alteribacter natronophilus]|uniref:paeninodin family lasso peptide n=1 Tax=Alteribacter natronophilus TaxID=2583810 RepID=UPI00110E2B57|nr:paeninodin family lasso peptide [Alteribacter natronophilus]TMW70533.1 paeninodin family lasso peptide [Alteribacter natronophilus]